MDELRITHSELRSRRVSMAADLPMPVAVRMRDAPRARAPVCVRGGVPARGLSLVIGLLLCALGILLAITSRLGPGAWAVLAQGIVRKGWMSLGNATILISAVIMAIALLLGAQLGVGMIADAVLVGVFIDGLTHLPIIEWIGHAPALVRAGVLIASLVAFSLGSALYLAAGVGGGPRDSLMLAIRRRSGRSIARSRLAIELSVLALGLGLGGMPGLGTIFAAVCVGPRIQVSFGLLERAHLTTSSVYYESSAKCRAPERHSGRISAGAAYPAPGPSYQWLAPNTSFWKASNVNGVTYTPVGHRYQLRGDDGATH